MLSENAVAVQVLHQHLVAGRQVGYNLGSCNGVKGRRRNGSPHVFAYFNCKCGFSDMEEHVGRNVASLPGIADFSCETFPDTVLPVVEEASVAAVASIEEVAP